MIQDRTSVFSKAFIELTLGLSDVLKVTLCTFYQKTSLPASFGRLLSSLSGVTILATTSHLMLVKRPKD